MNYSKKTELEEKQSLVMFGDVGTGKTHLAVSIMKNLPPVDCFREEWEAGLPKQVPAKRKARSIFLIVDEFFQELNDAAVTKRSKMEIIKGYLENYDCVCLDDLGVKNFSEAKQENLYLFLNRAYVDNRRIILTTNFSLETLSNYDSRITSRLNEMAEIIVFSGKDYRLNKNVA